MLVIQNNEHCNIPQSIVKQTNYWSFLAARTGDRGMSFSSPICLDVSTTSLSTVVIFTKLMPTLETENNQEEIASYLAIQFTIRTFRAHPQNKNTIEKIASVPIPVFENNGLTTQFRTIKRINEELAITLSPIRSETTWVGWRQGTKRTRMKKDISKSKLYCVVSR